MASILKSEVDDQVQAFWAVFVLAKGLRVRLRQLLADEPWAADAGVSPYFVGALRVIARLGSVSQKEIAEALVIDPSDLVGVLDVFEAADLVRRQRDPNDRRRHTVELTAKGRRAVRRLDVLQARAGAEALGNLDPDERRQLVALISKAVGDGDSAPVRALLQKP